MSTEEPILLVNQDNKGKTPEIDILLVACMKHNASDLHLKAGDEPILRIYGKIHRLGKSRLTIDSIERMTFEIMSPAEVCSEPDCTWPPPAPGVGRPTDCSARKRSRIGAATSPEGRPYSVRFRWSCWEGASRARARAR
jgi:hypothetical protein